ncbi:hypothetical protein [Halomarina rubra]|uniref:hypothetical protein n=1 Tax=Halomarina rubra TaxID=2071873 RepID=UPI0020324D00|nr:hypothetical protein [Halomarina rubra]
MCEDCERVISGRVEEDGSIILPLAGNRCTCGGEKFDVVEPVGGPKTDAAPG